MSACLLVLCSWVFWLIVPSSGWDQGSLPMPPAWRGFTWFINVLHQPVFLIDTGCHGSQIFIWPSNGLRMQRCALMCCVHLFVDVSLPDRVGKLRSLSVWLVVACNSSALRNLPRYSHHPMRVVNYPLICTAFCLDSMMDGCMDGGCGLHGMGTVISRTVFVWLPSAPCSLIFFDCFRLFHTGWLQLLCPAKAKQLPKQTLWR